MASNIIAISGKAGSGKDTVAEYLVEKHNFTKIAFADPIKRFAKDVFSFNVDELWGPSDYRNADVAVNWEHCREQLFLEGKLWLHHLNPCKKMAEVDIQFAKLVNWFDDLHAKYPGMVSPRVVLQTLGTEYGRVALGDHVWVDYLLDVAEAVLMPGHTYTAVSGLSSTPVPTGVVISDLRFLNEIKAVSAHGGKIIQVERKSEKDVVGVAGHASEKEQEQFSAEHFDFLINNNGTIEELYSAVDVFVGSLK